MRNSIKKTLFKTIDLAGLNRSYIRRQKKVVLVLTYHSVIPFSEKYKRFDYRNCVTEEAFDMQIGFLKKNYSVVSMNEAANAIRDNSIHERMAVITFDDGFKNNFLYAMPVLNQNNVSGMFYVTTGFIGKKETLWTEAVNHFIMNTHTTRVELLLDGTKRTFSLTDTKQKENASIAIRNYLKFSSMEEKNKTVAELFAQINDVPDPVDYDPDRYGFLTWAEVNKLLEGGMEIGSHTHMHHTLNMLDAKASYDDIKMSKTQIEKNTSVACKHFSYPNGEKGNFLPHHFDQLKELGFDSATTQVKGLNRGNENPYTLKRINITAKMNMDVFKAYCSGTYRLVT